MLRNVFSGCVSDRSSQAEVFRTQKLKFGASLSSALKHGFLPGPLVEILVYIAKEGVATADVFRRPGNPNDTRRIVKRLTEGKQVIYSNYSFYTLASVVKKFLLKIPGGVFTPAGEEQLLLVLMLQNKQDQIEAVRNFIETLMPAHQQLVALLFGTWFRIVTFSEVNCMSVEALSRSVAGSMFHTCAEDPAKVEKASRMMHFLIDNYGVEGMFGCENIKYFTETTHTTIHIRELYHYSCCTDTEFIPRDQVQLVFIAYLEKEATKKGFDLIKDAVQSDIIEVTRMDQQEEEEAEEAGFLGRDRKYSGSLQVSPTVMRHSDISDESQVNINISTLSAPEVSLVPSPEVSKRPKSLEDNLNEVRSHYQSRCLSRFNSVKRKQLERLRQRSDWFLSPSVRERNNSRKGRGEFSSFFSGSSTSGGQEDCDQDGNCGSKTGHNNNSNHRSNNNHHQNGSSIRTLQQKNSGNSVVTKASSEGAVLDVFSDGDSVFTDNTSRSESPASEPVWSHILKVHSRDIIHSDTANQLAVPELSLHEGSSGFDISIGSQEELFCNEGVAPISTALASGCDSDITVQRSKEAKEEEEDDDDNTTPTGGQEEEDPTIMASSLPDLTQHSSGSSTQNEDLDKDSPVPHRTLGDIEEAASGVSPVIASGISSLAQAEEEKDSMQEKNKMSPGADKFQLVSSSGRERLGHSDEDLEPKQEREGEIVKCFLVERTYAEGESKKDS